MKLNGTWRNIADDRLALWTHIVRRPVDDYPEGQFRSDFAAELDEKYRARVTAKRMFVNEHYLTLIMRPAVGSADRTGLLLKRIAKARAADEEVDPDELARFERRAISKSCFGVAAPRGSLFMSKMASYSPGRSKCSSKS
jgi:type IV secretion system protein VirB4